MSATVRTREEIEITSRAGRVLVAGGRIRGGQRVALEMSARHTLDEPHVRALGVWLLAQADAMTDDESSVPRD